MDVRGPQRSSLGQCQQSTARSAEKGIPPNRKMISTCGATTWWREEQEVLCKTTDTRFRRQPPTNRDPAGRRRNTPRPPLRRLRLQRRQLAIGARLEKKCARQTG